jgi:hypothetical protein
MTRLAQMNSLGELRQVAGCHVKMSQLARKGVPWVGQDSSYDDEVRMNGHALS